MLCQNKWDHVVYIGGKERDIVGLFSGGINDTVLYNIVVSVKSYLGHYNHVM